MQIYTDDMQEYTSIHNCEFVISIYHFRRRGSNVYEFNLWLWSFARGKPRLGGLSVEKTFERQVAANEESKERAAENRRRCKADKA
jgi:hypothetical protein